MKRIVFAILISLLYVSGGVGSDWPNWRGPQGNGVAPSGPAPPLNWSDAQNIIWKTPIPGRGHSSPTVVGDRIYLTTADEQAGSQSMLAVDRGTGTIVWQTVVYKNRRWPRIHAKNTHATSTVACDGQRLFSSFYSEGKIRHSCLSRDGEILWQRDLAQFVPKYPFGYAASPVLYGGTVVVAAESEAETTLIALDRKTGDEVWRTPRPTNSSYSSPVLLRVGGREQILISGNQQIRAYDPATGRNLWQANGSTKHTCGTVTGEGELVVASGGYPGSETFCAKADGSGEVLWRNRQKCYEQSLIMHGGIVYAVNDTGVAYCWDARTGRELWKKRLAGPISSSPVLVGDRVYVTNERGTTFVFKANRSRFVSLARNQLGDDAFPTPTFLDGRIYARVGVQRGSRRQEMLYCIGES